MNFAAKTLLLLVAVNAVAENKKKPPVKKLAVHKKAPAEALIGTPIEDEEALVKDRNGMAERERLQLPAACLDAKRNFRFEGKGYTFRSATNKDTGAFNSMSVTFPANGKQALVNFNGTEKISIDLTQKNLGDGSLSPEQLTLKESIAVYDNYPSKELKESGQSIIPEREAKELKECLQAMIEANFLIDVESIKQPASGLKTGENLITSAKFDGESFGKVLADEKEFCALFKEPKVRKAFERVVEAEKAEVAKLTTALADLSSKFNGLTPKDLKEYVQVEIAGATAAALGSLWAIRFARKTFARNNPQFDVGKKRATLAGLGVATGAGVASDKFVRLAIKDYQQLVEYRTEIREYQAALGTSEKNLRNLQIVLAKCP